MTGLVFEVGGTHWRIGLTDGRRLLRSVRIKTPASWSSAKKALVLAVVQLKPVGKINRVIGGIAGVLNHEGDQLISSPNIRGWVNKPIKRDLQTLFRAPVRLENDADVAALGEAINGVGRGFKAVAYITLGTGIGGARVINGQLDRGRTTFEPAHIYLMSGKTWEDLIGGVSLQHRFGRDWSDWISSDWKWVEQQLAIGLANVVNLWSPDMIILNGTVGQNRHIRLAIVQQKVSKLLRTIKTCPPIRRGKLKDQAGPMGAIRLLS